MTLICGWIYFITSISVVHSQSVIESPHCPSSKQVCIEKATFNSAHALDGRYKWFNYSFLNLSCYYNQYTNTYIYPSIVTLDAVPRVRFQYFIKQNDEVIAKCNITSDAPVLSQCQWSLFDIHNNKWRVDTDIIVTECGDICAHGTAFEWIAFNKSHRTNVYECIMCKPVLYLYGWIDIESNSNTTIYSWKISENSNHGTQHVHGSCFCGMNFDSHYTFNINDCQYWERNDHSLSDMRVTECEHCVQLDPNSEMRRSYVLNGVSRDFTVGFDLNVAGFMIMLPDDASLVLKYSCRDANALFEDSTSINIRVSSLDTVYHSISESCDNAKSISIAFATINMTTAVYLDNVYIYHKKYHRQHNTRRSLLIGNETIFCNGSVTDTIADNPQPHMYRLTLTNTTDVTFSNCDSQTDLYLKVLTASSRVISEPFCSGGDGCRGCPDPAHRSHESFTIPMMAVGTYQIEIIAIDVGGDYQIDIDCAEPSGPNLFCNDSVTDTIPNFPRSHLYVFALMNTTDITFSDCDSQTDLYLKVLNVSSHVISDPYCGGGDGCGGCSNGVHESYTMQLSAGTYLIQVMAWNEGGDYQIDIDCAEPPERPGLDIDCADPLIPPGPNLFCNDSVTYRITSFRGSHLYVFTLMNTTDVTFSDCDSQIDLNLKVLNASSHAIPNFPQSHIYVFALTDTVDVTFSDCSSPTDIELRVLNASSHVISDPYCDQGDGCGGCSKGDLEHVSYTMQLSAGTYQIQVMARDNLGDYQVDIDCADPLIPPGPNLFCNDSVTYRITSFRGSHLYVFTLMNTTDVTFSDCDSQIDLNLKVLNASSHVISDPYCDQGDGCGGCSKGDLEHVSYTMQLSAGTYHIQVMAWNDGGDYQVDIDCAEPPSHTPTESPSKMPTRSPLPDNRTYSPSQKPSYRPSNGGCFNTEAEFQKEVIPHRIYACSGIIKGGGFYGTDAQALCTDDYHVCDSAIEAKSLGLTAAICNNVAGGSESKFFGTKESSKDFYECTSDYPLSSGFNNAWGCGGAIFYDSACDETLTKLIKKDDDVTYQWWEFQSHWTEAASVSLKNAAGGGVLCCIGESKYTPYPDLYECVTDGSITSHYQGTSYSDHEENEAVEWEDIATDKYDANVTDGDGLSSDAYDTLSGYRVLSGDTTSRIRFEPMLSENHTVISLCKYNGANKNTIFQTDNGDIFGFYEGRAGVAFENGWITDEFNHITDDWLLSAQTPYLYRGNGFSYTRDNGQGSTGYLGINYGNVSDEDSDWSCAEVIIIADKMLTLREIKCIENAINIKYNLALPNVGTPSPTLEPTNAPTDIPTLHPTRSPIECPYGTFKPTVDGDTCFSCGKNIGGFECLGKSVVNVQSGYWIAAKLDNRFVSLIDDKLASLNNYTISSIRCASGYCCNDRNGCDYFDAMQKGELCAEGRNVSSITCSACDNNLSELLNSNSCGVCRESKYSYFGALYVTSLIFSGLMIFVFSKPPNVWNQMKSKTEIEQVDWYRILIKDEQDIVKTLVLKVILYYYQAMTQILSTRNIVPLSQFESTLLSLANFEIPSSLGGSSGICFIANIQSGLHEILISYSFYVFLFFNAAVFAILSYNIRILASFKPFIKTGMISVVLMCAGPMLSTSFKLVACLSIEDFGYFHLYDSRKQCFGFFWIFGLIMILIICVVFVVFWYLVFTQSVLERDNESNRYRSLVNKYKSNVWFWEFVLFLRRLGIALLTSINYIASSIISIGLISFIVILFGLQAKFNPFKYARANVLETISLFGLVSIIICVNFINAADEYHIYIMWYFTFLIAMPFLVVMAMVLRIIYRWCYFRKGGDQQKDVDVINKQQKQLHRIKERMPSSYKKWFDEVLKGTGDTHDDMDEGAMDDETGIVYDTMNETEIQAQDGKPKDDSISSSIDVDPGVPQRTNDSDHDGSDADTVPQHMNWKMKEKMKRHVQNQ
eukprot:784795_1